jgi:magnesium transporter
MEGLSSDEVWQVLRHADPATRSEIFHYFDRDRQLELIRTQPREEIAQLIASMAPDDRVDILNDLEPEVVQQLLEMVPSEHRRDILRLSAYPEGTAGAVMTTEVAKLNESLTVSQALKALQKQSEKVETIYYLYIVDESDRLLGLVSTRQLISSLGKPDATLGELMETELITVDVDDDQEIVAQKVAQYDLLAIPVVDDQHRMLGIITYDDVIDVVREEAVEDAQRIGGMDPLKASYLRIGFLTLGRKRGVWLGLLFVFSLVTAFTLKRYEQRLFQWEWLVVFIPLVISTGGNTGNQSATLIITALVNKDIVVHDWRRIVRRELMMGLLLGGFLALFGLLLSFVIPPGSQGVRPALVLPVTLLLVVVCGNLFGSTLPLVFQRLGWDPALMSNPFVAGLIDIVGIIIYINVAILLLSGAG